MDGLSIREAAARFGDQDFLIAGGERWTFARLAERVEHASPVLRSEPLFINATATVDTLVTMLCAMEQHVPLVLLHSGWSADERFAMVQTFGSLSTGTTVPGRDTFGVLFTSGSLGQPRGVVLSRRAVIAAARLSEERLGWEANDRWICALPLAHAGGISIFVRCLLAGRSVVLMEGFSVDGVLSAIERERATMLSVVPTMLQRLLEADQKNLLAQLRILLVGGAAIRHDLMTECEKRNICAMPTYGMTETASQIATGRSGPSGGLRPLRDVGIRILAPDGTSCPAGTTGRIAVCGPQIMDGYLGEEPIIPSSFLITDDAGCMDDSGGLHVLGRLDETIITGGENVHPAQVESVVRAFPHVADCVVFGVEDQRWGQVVAVALAWPASHVFDEDSFRRFCADRLPLFRVPRYVAVMDTFNLLAGGKVDRQSVVRQALPLLHRLHRAPRP